jgi:hypothetical protein
MIIWLISLYVFIGVSRQGRYTINSELFDPKSVRVCNVSCQSIHYFNTNFVENNNGFILPSSFQDILMPVNSPNDFFDEKEIKKLIFGKCPNKKDFDPQFLGDEVGVDNLFLIIERESEAGKLILKKKDDIIRFESITREIEELKKKIMSTNGNISHNEMYQKVHKDGSDRSGEHSSLNFFTQAVENADKLLTGLSQTKMELEETLISLKEELGKTFKAMSVFDLLEKGFVPEKDLLIKKAASESILI